MRGEWVELTDPVDVAPEPPCSEWSARTVRAWRAWWSDPASTQWGPSDVDLLEHCADVFDVWLREGRGVLATEVRHLRDSLGLTPKGKRDLRWRVVVPESEVDERKSRREQMEELSRRAASAGRVEDGYSREWLQQMYAGPDHERNAA